MSEKLIVYITKYALTRGIIRAKAQTCDDIGKGIISAAIDPRENNHLFFGEGREWHRTLGEAENRFESMKSEKYDNLKNQMLKLAHKQIKMIDLIEKGDDCHK